MSSLTTFYRVTFWLIPGWALSCTLTQSLDGIVCDGPTCSQTSDAVSLGTGGTNGTPNSPTDGGEKGVSGPGDAGKQEGKGNPSAATDAGQDGLVSNPANDAGSEGPALGEGSERCTTDKMCGAGRVCTQGYCTPGLWSLYWTETVTDGKRLRPSFELINAGREDVPLEELTLRYYFTTETGGSEQFYECVDTGSFDCSSVTSSFVVVDLQEANRYLELGFTAAAGSLRAGGASTGEIKGIVQNQDFQVFTQSNDYSFEPMNAEREPHPLVPVYRKGQLIWGVEPGVRQ